MQFTKNQLRAIKQLAETLPLMFYQCWENTEWKGSELYLTPMADQMKLEMDETYIIPMPVYRNVNHYRRLRERMEKGGPNYAMQYISHIDSLKKSGYNVINMP